MLTWSSLHYEYETGKNVFQKSPIGFAWVRSLVSVLSSSAAARQAMMQQDEELVAMANTLTGARVFCAFWHKCLSLVLFWTLKDVQTYTKSSFSDTSQEQEPMGKVFTVDETCTHFKWELLETNDIFIMCCVLSHQRHYSMLFGGEVTNETLSAQPFFSLLFMSVLSFVRLVHVCSFEGFTLSSPSI